MIFLKKYYNQALKDKRKLHLTINMHNCTQRSPQTNTYGELYWIWIKTYFPLKSPLFILERLLLNRLTESVIYEQQKTVKYHFQRVLHLDLNH